jgi:O-methyltransferase
MTSVILKAGRFFYRKFQSLQPFLLSAYSTFHKPNFSGWGMKTDHEVPWNDEYNWKSFRSACVEVKQNFELTENIPSTVPDVDALMWRHWIVSYATRMALKFSKTNEYNFAECGVADGQTSFFTLQEIKEQGKLQKSTMHLYDSWAGMEKERLLETEYDRIGEYHTLELARTKRNLKEFKEHIVYHVGYVPNSFKNNPPESVVFLHIDLNSAKPTLSTLDFFFPRLVNNGIILFDDYGDLFYGETKRAVDKFFKDKFGVLEKLPTGQAIYYHLK